MWSDDDILRSVRRYLAMTLEAPPWTLRVERREVKDEERPVGVVVAGALSTSKARTSLIQGDVTEVMPVTITLYPAVADATADGIRAGRLEASKLKSHLNELINTGLTVEAQVEERTVQFAGPFRMPLWDYEGVPLTGEERAGPDDPHAVMWVDEASANVQAIQDLEDATRWTVVANFRVSIERPGRTAPDDQIRDIDRFIGVEKPIV